MGELSIARLQGTVLRLHVCLNSFIGNYLGALRLGPSPINQDSVNLREAENISPLNKYGEADRANVDWKNWYFPKFF
jgi:hypothetical protein